MLFLGLHFEHTYFINEINMVYLCNECNFEIINKYYYNSHSIFYHLKKKKMNYNIPLNFIKEFNLGYKKILISKIDEIKNKVNEINNFIINKKDIYIFGCHSNSHAMLYFGLNTERIKYILDNDPMKNEKKMYGFELVCKKPDIISNDENPIVICNVGPYTEEIKKQLLEINKNVQIL